MTNDAVDVVTVHVRIEGRVQGVGYRAWTASEAIARGLGGWVRNRSDRSVEAVFSGPRPVVEAMIAACSHGPPAARVRGVHAKPADAPDDPGFRMLPTV